MSRRCRRRQTRALGAHAFQLGTNAFLLHLQADQTIGLDFRHLRRRGSGVLLQRGAAPLQIDVGVGEALEALGQAGELFQHGGIIGTSLAAEPGGEQGLPRRLAHLIVEESSPPGESALAHGGRQSIDVFAGTQAADGPDWSGGRKMVEDPVDACDGGGNDQDALAAGQAVGQKTASDERFAGAGHSLDETQIGSMQGAGESLPLGGIEVVVEICRDSRVDLGQIVGLTGEK
jgi:hypothetical protein